MAIDLRVLTRVKRISGRHASELLRMPVVANHRLTRAYGRFHGGKRRVELAAWLANDKAELKDTFLHEVAHAICFFAGVKESAHGPAWKRIAALLGAVPVGFGDTDVEGQAAYRPQKTRAAKAVGRCESCGFIFRRTRALPAGERICANRDEDGLVCHGSIRKYRSRAKRKTRA